MALGITVAFNNSANSPGVTVSLSGLTGFNTYRVTRIDNGSVYPESPVRGADGVNVIGNTAVITDNESPISTSVKYRLDGYVAGVLTSTVTSANITISASDPVFSAYYNHFFVKNVNNSSLSRAVVVGDFSGLDFDPAILGNYKVLGRRNPVVFTDVWGARTGHFSIHSLLLLGVQSSTVDLEALFQSGDVLLFQSALQPYVYQDMYFIVTGFSRSGYSNPHVTDAQEFTYDVQFQEVDRPASQGLSTGLGTWGNLRDDPAASAVSWTTVTAAYATYTDLLNHYST